MTVFNKFVRSFKSHWLLYLCVIVFGITNLVASSGAHMVQRLLFSFWPSWLLNVYHPFRFACLLPYHLCYWLRQIWVLASIHGVSLVQLSMMDLRLVCCRVIRMKLSKCWECISLIYVLLPFYPFFFAVIIKYDVSLPTKKWQEYYCWLSFRAVYFPLVNLLIKMQK